MRTVDDGTEFLIGNDTDFKQYLMKQSLLTVQVFRFLMVCSAFLVCLSHGSNDVGNAISPLLLVMDTNGQDDYLSFFIGALGIAFGLFFMGEKVMQTVGKDIVILDFMKGFCAQFSTATCVCLGSSLGMPLSTTHCMIGSLAGISVAGKTPWMKRAYAGDDNNKKGEESKMNMEVIYKIIIWWLMTIPAALISSFLISDVLISFAKNK